MTHKQSLALKPTCEAVKYAATRAHHINLGMDVWVEYFFGGIPTEVFCAARKERARMLLIWAARPPMR